MIGTLRAKEFTEFERQVCALFAAEMDKAGMTQAKMSRKAKCSPHAVASFMAGRTLPQVANLHQMIEVLGLPLWAFIRAAEERAKRVAVTNEQRQLTEL